MSRHAQGRRRDGVRRSGPAAVRRVMARPQPGPRLLGLAAAFALAAVLLPSGCGVPRADRASVDRSDYSTLPNLRRAQEELQVQITREEEHVAALLQRNLSLRTEEEAFHAQMLAAEQDYQLRQQDLQAVQADLERVHVELAAARAALEEARAQHAEVLAETGRILEEMAELQRLVQRGQVARDALPAEVRAFLAALPEPIAPAAPAEPQAGAEPGAADTDGAVAPPAEGAEPAAGGGSAEEGSTGDGAADESPPSEGTGAGGTDDDEASGSGSGDDEGIAGAGDGEAGGGEGETEGEAEDESEGEGPAQG
jgi:hypothetical protein